MVSWASMSRTGQMELLYADQFTVDYYDDYSLVTVDDSNRYLLVPEGKEIPEGLDQDITAIRLPVENLYLAASSAMDLFRELDALDVVRMTGTTASGWTLPVVRERLDEGSMLYSGKYSAPDFEMLVSENCDLAIESTMIYHSPEVKEQLEFLDIPVMVERSSYESHPLGRCEWIRLYGLLTGKEAEAESFMKANEKRFDDVLSRVAEIDEKPEVAFFYVSSNGYVNVRKPGDYISKMITMAGGDYCFADYVPEEENALSTMNMQMEVFYEGAVDADILIYNSTVDTELYTMEDLFARSQLLADFKAVGEGKVWCTGQNMFQETSRTMDVIEDLSKIMTGSDEPLTYLHLIE